MAAASHLMHGQEVSLSRKAQMPNYSSNAQFSGQLRKQSEAGAKILLLEYKKKKKNSPQISRSRSGPQIPLLLLCVPTACQQINTLKLKLSSLFFFLPCKVQNTLADLVAVGAHKHDDEHMKHHHRDPE